MSLIPDKDRWLYLSAERVVELVSDWKIDDANLLSIFNAYADGDENEDTLEKTLSLLIWFGNLPVQGTPPIIPAIIFQGLPTYGSGAPGPTGSPGVDGNTILNGTTPPSNSLGKDGDSYFDRSAKLFYSPKAGGVWPAGFSMIGPAGANGTNGTNGKTILNGTSNPNAGIGTDGDFYYNRSTNFFFGPKASGVWPAGISVVGPAGKNGYTILSGSGAPADNQGVKFDFYLNLSNYTLIGPKPSDSSWSGAPSKSLVGPQGPSGATGSNGKTVLSGAGVPSNATGTNGDFYINITNWTIFGPKTAGIWPTGVSLVGPAGANGTNGTNGTNGLPGADGKTVLNGTTNPTDGIGEVGDFYLNTVTYQMWGPKGTGMPPWSQNAYLRAPFDPLSSVRMYNTVLEHFTSALIPTSKESPVGLYIKDPAHNPHSIGLVTNASLIPPTMVGPGFVQINFPNPAPSVEREYFFFFSNDDTSSIFFNASLSDVFASTMFISGTGTHRETVKIGYCKGNYGSFTINAYVEIADNTVLGYVNGTMLAGSASYTIPQEGVLLTLRYFKGNQQLELFDSDGTGIAGFSVGGTPFASPSGQYSPYFTVGCVADDSLDMPVILDSLGFYQTLKNPYPVI